MGAHTRIYRVTTLECDVLYSFIDYTYIFLSLGYYFSVYEFETTRAFCVK